MKRAIGTSYLGTRRQASGNKAHEKHKHGCLWAAGLRMGKGSGDGLLVFIRFTFIIIFQTVFAYLNKNRKLFKNNILR